MKWLVTGGAGFIGSNFIEYILGKYTDTEVVNLDKLTYAGNLENCRTYANDKRYRFVKGDICDKELVAKLMADVEVVVNFAAETHVDRSIQEAGVFVQSNVSGVYTLLEAARKSGALKKFVQISTDEVYGSIKTGKSKETDVFQPNSPYSASKAAAEHFARAYHVTYSLPALITRSSNNYGPHQYPEKLIPLFIKRLKEGKKVPVYGTGKNVRDWLYVMDNCEGIDVVVQKGKPGETYNIGGECEKTNLQVTSKLLELMGKGKEMIGFVADRPGHDFRYALDCNKIKKLGWKPRTSFDKGMRKTVEYYLKGK